MNANAPNPGVRVHEIAGGERLDEIAFRYYGDPSLWRLLAGANNLDDPLRLEPFRTIWIPLLPGRRPA
jgi:nucleoid-associated protein YgaU